MIFQHEHCDVKSTQIEFSIPEKKPKEEATIEIINTPIKIM